MYRVVMTIREYGPDSFISFPVSAPVINLNIQQTQVSPYQQTYNQVSTTPNMSSTIRGNLAVAMESVLVNSEELAIEAVEKARTYGMSAFYFKVRDDA